MAWKRLLMQSYMDIASSEAIVRRQQEFEDATTVPPEDITAPGGGNLPTDTHVVPPHEDDGPLPSVPENEVFTEPTAPRERSGSLTALGLREVLFCSCQLDFELLASQKLELEASKQSLQLCFQAGSSVLKLLAMSCRLYFKASDLKMSF